MKIMISRNFFKRSLLFCMAILAIGVAPIALAETSEVNPSGFLVSLHQEVKADPHQVFLAISQVGKWWNRQHTWSGNAANLSLDLVAGGCFCERWDANSAQHALVVLVKKDALVRMVGSLGPLQDMALNGVLTFAINVKEGKTILTVNYRVNGGAKSNLDELAAPVEGVLAEQMHRLVAYAEGGAVE
jgi:hypothetical protein